MLLYDTLYHVRSVLSRCFRKRTNNIFSFLMFLLHSALNRIDFFRNAQCCLIPKVMDVVVLCSLTMFLLQCTRHVECVLGQIRPNRSNAHDGAYVRICYVVLVLFVFVR